MGMKAIFAISRWLLLFFACFGFAFGTAWAESGIRVKEWTQLTPGAPPCNVQRTTTFKITIRNTNCVCNEDVNPITKATLLDDGVKTEASPKGSFDLLGFKKSLSGSLSPTLSFIDMEDETEETFYFDVKTGPVPCTVTGGGDFEKAEFGITICDGGGGCDWGASYDPPYPVCESPKHTLRFTLKADTTLCPKVATGTGRIQGTVRDSVGDPIVGAHVRAKKGCRGNPDYVNESDRTSRGLLPNRPPKGGYEISGLPSPATYEMEVQASGLCATATVTIPTAGGTVTQDFTLTTACP